MRTSTLLLLLAVLALGLYIGLFERRMDSTDKKREIARRVLRFDPTRITGVRVVREGLQFALEKREDQWRLSSPFAARADAGAVARLIDNLELLERSDVIRAKEQRKQGLTLSDFGLDPPRARIVLASPEKTWTLLVGRDTPVGENLFLKEENDTTVFVTSTNLLADLPAGVDVLRDRRLFLGFPGEVTRLDIRRREGLLNLVRTEGGGWRMQQPWTGRAALDAVKGLLDPLFTTRIAEFVAESFDAASLYGLDEPAAQVSLIGDRRHGEQVLQLGKPVERNTNQVYATLQPEGFIFTVDRALLDALQLKADTVRDRRLLTLPAHEIGYIRVEEGERSIHLARGEAGAWELLEPWRGKADDARLQAAIAEWTGLRIEAFVDQPGTNLVEWGFEPPARRIVFARRPPEPATNGTAAARADGETAVWVSALPASNQLALVKLASDETLYRVSADTLGSLPMSPLFFRHPRVLSFEQEAVRGLAVQRAGREERVTRDSATNEFVAAARAAVNPAAVREILGLLSALHAQEYLAENVAQPADYGLAEPQAQVTVSLQGGATPARTLLLGAERADGSTCAMLRGGDVVFAIPRETRDKLLQSLYNGATTTKDAPSAEPNTQPAAAP
jgi:hypothetical protein